MSSDRYRAAEPRRPTPAASRVTEPVPSKAALAGHPIHPMLIAMPIGLLVFALVADVAYAVTDDGFFARMALWTVAAGLITGAAAAIAGAVDFLFLERPRRLQAGWIHAIGNGVVLVLVAISLIGRLTGGEDFVLPWGLTLSAIVGALLAVTGWYGGELSYRHLVGVDPKQE